MSTAAVAQSTGAGMSTGNSSAQSSTNGTGKNDVSLPAGTTSGNAVNQSAKTSATYVSQSSGGGLTGFGSGSTNSSGAMSSVTGGGGGSGK